MKLFLAPIQGITTACYRNAFARLFGGIDAYYSPFISATDIKKANPSLFKDLLAERNEAEVKLIPQLLSNNGEDFRCLANAIVQMGYNEINWNIGCPSHVVTRKRKGSGILPYSDMINKFLEIACADSSHTVTVKMRLGLDDPEEGLRVMKVLNEYPLGGVIIHARTGAQMYTGSVDLDSFEALASSCKHEVTYNGDIFSVDDFTRIRSRFPFINSFMLGRGALRNPFLPSAIKGQLIPPEQQLTKLKQFHDEFFTFHQKVLYGEKHLCDRMKEFWSYLSVYFDEDDKLMKKIKKCHTTEEYLQIVRWCFM